MEKGALDLENITHPTSEVQSLVTTDGKGSAEVIAENRPVPLVRVGLRDTFPRSGRPEKLLDYYNMGVSDIVAAAQKAIEKKTER